VGVFSCGARTPLRSLDDDREDVAGREDEVLLAEYLTSVPPYFE